MLETFSGATRVLFILGHPIAQVKSPAGMTRLFADEGIDAVMVPVDVAPGDLDAFARAVGPLRNLDGLCVTVPHKFAMARHCASLSATSRFLGAVNVLRRNPDSTWDGDMVDGPAQVAAFRRAGAAIEDRTALLVGAGGAGGAIGLALLDAGVRALRVHDADAARRDALVAKLGGAYPSRVAAGAPDPTGVDILANATPAGMAGFEPLPVDVARLDAATFVGDVVTKPEITPLLTAARAKGCRTSTGVDMFEAGRRLQFDFWYGPGRRSPLRSALAAD